MPIIYCLIWDSYCVELYKHSLIQFMQQSRYRHYYHPIFLGEEIQTLCCLTSVIDSAGVQIVFSFSNLQFLAIVLFYLLWKYLQ